MAPRHTQLIIVLACAAGLAACGKAKEKVDEKITEKVLESAMSSDGTKAKVDLSAGQTTITTTDAQGNTTVMEVGNAKVTEAELGLTLYPGSTPVADGSSRTQSTDGSMIMAGYESKDSIEKVAGFYRDQLRARAGGKQMMDNSSSDAVVLILSDPEKNAGTQVTIGKNGSGSTIEIVATRAAAK